MSVSNNFSKYLTSKLSGLKTNNITKSGSLNFGSLTAMKNYMSIFQNSGLDISSMNYEEILQALQSGSLEGLSETDQSFAGVINELLSIDEFSKLADVSGDEQVDASELEAIISQIAGNDGDAKELSFDDINKLFDKIGVDLDKTAENAVKDAISEAKEEAEAEEAKKAEEEKAAEKAKEAEAAQAASSAPSSSGGGGSVGGGGGSVSGGSSNAVSGKGAASDAKNKTPDEIKKEISDKESEIDSVESEAEQKIGEIETKKNEALENAGIPKEDMEKYKAKEEELDNKIKDKEAEISKKDDEISDYNSSISSNESYINSIEDEIQQNEAAKGKISGDDKDASSKKSEIDSKISNLKSEKDKKEKENADLKKKVETAENDKQTLNKEKEALEKEKSELLSDVMKNSKLPTSEQDKIKEQIKGYEEEIKQVKAEKDEKVNGLKKDIQALQVDLKNAEALEERAEFLKDNKANCGLGLTGEELVDVAKQMLQKYGSSSGYCATGVSRTFAMAYGLNLNGNGCDWDSNMDSLVDKGYFVEVTGDYGSAADLSNCPAGAVICWENTGGTSGGGAQYGHVTIADGNGGEISDHYSNHIYTHLKSYRVYLPVESA